MLLGSGSVTNLNSQDLPSLSNLISWGLRNTSTYEISEKAVYLISNLELGLARRTV